MIPSEASVGSEITIRGRGFTEQNDIAFTYLVPIGWFRGYITRIPALDEKTIKFILPYESPLLGACPMSTNEAPCPAIGLPLPDVETEIVVVNKHGESNPKRFRVRPCSPEDKEPPLGGQAAVDFTKLMEVIIHKLIRTFVRLKGDNP